MRIKTNTVNSVLLFQTVFLTFLGFYAILLLAINAGMSGFTRQVTIPVRVLIVLSLIGLVVINVKKVNVNNYAKIFLVFSAIFIARIAVDYYQGAMYYLSSTEVLFYFVSFSIIPFLTISTFRLREDHVKLILNSFFISGFIFSVLSFVFYRDFLGQVGRLTTSVVGEEVISPLVLSYCATLVIGVIVFYLVFNKTSTFRKIIGVLTFLLSIAPFFLGASRGALIALFFPFLFLLLARNNLKAVVQGLALLAVFFLAGIFLSDNLGSGLFRRFSSITSDIEQGSDSAMRLVMWANSASQFKFNPIFGDQLGVEGFNGFYPHNLILEVLQTTGVVGFIPFFILVLHGFYICFSIFKTSVQHSWVCVVFIQAFSQSMFSGALVTSAWFWSSLALLFAVAEFISFENRRTKIF